MDFAERYLSDGVFWFRHDSNLPPLGFWRDNEGPDEQGLCENFHIQALYWIYDRLLERYPDMLIEGCAGGGHRIDLETLSRNHGYWAADLFDGQPEAMQACIYGANLFLLPNLHNTVLAEANMPREDTPANRYRFFSVVGGAPCATYDLESPEHDAALSRRWLEILRRVRPLTQGAFYPLEPHSADKGVWMAYQFHRADLDQGLVVAFRRPEAADAGKTYRLDALAGNGQYRLDYILTGRKEIRTGAELADGLRVELPNEPDVDLIHYTR